MTVQIMRKNGVKAAQKFTTRCTGFLTSNRDREHDLAVAVQRIGVDDVVGQLPQLHSAQVCDSFDEIALDYYSAHLCRVTDFRRYQVAHSLL